MLFISMLREADVRLSKSAEFEMLFGFSIV
jgi:hypothetical protein